LGISTGAAAAGCRSRAPLRGRSPAVWVVLLPRIQERMLPRRDLVGARPWVDRRIREGPCATAPWAISTAAGAAGWCEQRVWIKGTRSTAPIRHPDLGPPRVCGGAHAALREALTGQQQAMGERGGARGRRPRVSARGFPGRDLKVFLTGPRCRQRAGGARLDLERGIFPGVSLLKLEGPEFANATVLIPVGGSVARVVPGDDAIASSSQRCWRDRGVRVSGTWWICFATRGC